ncbi:hypothetical protein BH23ACT9_BH23ACT9_32550 [soil metagenome]
MTRHTASLLTLLMLTSILIALPAGAEIVDPCADEDGTIVYREEAVWFHEGETKVGNLSDRGDQAPAPWDTDAPTASVTAGAGAGAISNLGSTSSLAPGAANTAHFAGEFDGCIDTILVEMYAFQPTNRTGTSGSLEEAPHNFGLTVGIDGETYDLVGPLEAKTVANPQGSATHRIRFALTGVRKAMDQRKLDPASSHEMTLSMTAWFANTNNVIYLWDTTEVPAGMVFNGAVDTTTYTPIRLR